MTTLCLKSLRPILYTSDSGSECDEDVAHEEEEAALDKLAGSGSRCRARRMHLCSSQDFEIPAFDVGRRWHSP